MTAELVGWLRDAVAEVLAVDAEAVDLDANLDELGLSSRDAVIVAGMLEQRLGRPVPPTIAWEAPTIRALAERLTEPVPALVSAPAAPAEVADGRDPIAIVGLGCRLPGVDGDLDSPEAYWALLRDGGDAIGDVPAGRWELAGVHDVRADIPRRGGYLDDVTGFDAEWFGITPREAELMDPQQRILLEVTVDALRHGGLDVAGLRGSRTGVFVGVSSVEYGHLTAADIDAVEPWTATGAALSIAANRISYALDLRGPSLAVDTACSSSLAAVHQAVRSLTDGESDLAVAGGVNLLLTPAISAGFQRAGLLSDDGRCRAFGADSEGIGRSEGCGVVVLERLSDARARGHRVLALVTGSAVNSDGRSNGLTAPNPAAQEDVLRRACAAAGIDPSTVDYVEAHGTGTPLGDPIEAAALGRVHGAGRPADRPLLLGSVKSNLGHLEAAAGIAAVIKVVLALGHDTVPPTLHARVPNPYLQLERDRLELVQKPTAWPRHGGRARAGVSGFGFGGTNVHLVLEEGDPVEDAAMHDDPAKPAMPAVLTVSARSAPRARAAADALASWLDAAPDHALSTVAATLAARPDEGDHRVAVAARDAAGAAAALRASVPVEKRADPADPVWIFGGYGQQWDGMGQELYASEPVFTAAVDEAAAALDAAGAPGVARLVAEGRSPRDLAETMAALFAVQLGLAAWWRAHGVRPAAVIGQSLGEVAAAVVAGALTLPAGARVMAQRARLIAGIDAAGGGAMAVVDVAADDLLTDLIDWPDVEIASYAAPSQCVVAGPAEQVAGLVASLEARGEDAWPLPLASAGHSAAIDPVLPELRAALDGLPTAVPTVGWYSAVLDDPRGVPAFDADHWVANARRPVRLAQAVTAALADGHDTFLELSAHPVARYAVSRTVTDLVAAGTLTAERAAHVSVLAGPRRDDDGHVLTALAALHALGHPFLLAQRHPAGAGVEVPPVPWTRRRYWAPGVAERSGRPGGRSGRPAEPAVLLPAPARPGNGSTQIWAFDDSAALLALVGGDRLDVATLVRLAVAAGGDTEVTAVSLDSRPAPDTSLLLSCDVESDTAVELFAASGAAGWERIASARLVTAAPAVLAVPTVVETPIDTSVETDVLTVLREILGEIMAIPADEIDEDAALTDLGFDSLMATRARHAVEFRLGATIPVRLLVQGVSLRGLAETLGATPTEPAARHVAPRDPAERFLTGLWEQALGTERLGVTVPLGAHGADLAAAEQVRRGVVARAAHCVAASRLLAAGTIEAMADLVRADLDSGGAGRETGIVTTLREGEPGRPPLFVFHPAGGPCSVYRPLADWLDPRQPIFGLERLDSDSDHASVEERAERYLTEIRRLAPHGPYRLLGWSFGGLLAGECAQRLRALGEHVELLASIDTVLPRVRDTDDPGRLLVERYRRFAEHIRETYGADMQVPDDIAEQGEAAQLALLQDALGAAGVTLPEGVLRHQLTSYADARAAERYLPKPWPGVMVLYRADEAEALTVGLDPRYARSDATLGWDATVTELEVVRVPGNHITMIDPPHVDVLARDLVARLARLDDVVLSTGGVL